MKVATALLLPLLLVISKHVQSLKETRDRDRRQFAGDTVSSFSSDRKESGVGSLPFTLQECRKEPKVEHATVRCAYSGCRVRCEKNYKMASGALGTTTLQCDHSSGELTLNGKPYDPQQIACVPSCGLDGCFNGGTCIRPRTCACVEGYSGDHCEIAPEYALTASPDPNTCPEPSFPMINAEVTRSGQQLVVRCNPGHVFKIGGTVAFIECRNGDWDHPVGIFSEGGALVCQESQCNPPCQNGGVCLEEGVCDCPYKYWGSACQQIRCSYPDSSWLAHASLGGVHSRMKIQCHPRHKMVSGRRANTILCRRGQWILPGHGLLKDNDVKCYPQDIKTENA